MHWHQALLAAHTNKTEGVQGQCGCGRKPQRRPWPALPWPRGQEQTPFWQVCPKGQGRLQAPQLAPLVLRSTQLPEQTVSPEGGRPGRGSSQPVVQYLLAPGGSAGMRKSRIPFYIGLCTHNGTPGWLCSALLCKSSATPA